MELAKSDRGWMSGVADDDVVTIGVARVIQHEIDHLDGVEFVDRMASMESLTTVTNYLKFHR